jgi:hypothetical protein
MPFVKTIAWRAQLLLLTCLVVTSCAQTPPLPAPPVVVPEATVMPLSPEQKKPPLPSGAYWQLVTQWRNDWQATLKSLQDKYGR